MDHRVSSLDRIIWQTHNLNHTLSRDPIISVGYLIQGGQFPAAAAATDEDDAADGNASAAAAASACEMTVMYLLSPNE